MFSDDTLLYLERMSAAQILRFLVHAGLLGLNNQSKQVAGDTLVSTRQPGELKPGINEHWPKVSVQSLVASMDPSLLLLLAEADFVSADVFLQFVTLYFDVPDSIIPSLFYFIFF